MARVPVATNFRVQPGGPTGREVDAPTLRGFDPRASKIATPEFVTGRIVTPRYNPGLQAGTSPEAAGMAGRSLAAAGQTLQNVGGQAAQILTAIQEQTNGLVVDDALNKSKEVALRLTHDKTAGFSALRGFDALNRPDGKPLAEEYLGKFDDATREIAKNLKNDAQRQAYAREREGIRMSLSAQAIAHESAQFREYNLSVQEGTIATELNNMGANYNNPEIINQSSARLKGAVAMQGMALGKSAAWIEAKQLETVSKGHINVLGAALEDGNIGYADAYLKANGKDMTAEDTLRYRGLVNKEVDTRVAINVAADVMGQIAPGMGGETDFGRMVGITAQSESGNRERDDKGNLITSRRGAQGKMQVMPTTNTDPGFGVTPARDGSDAERTRVGNDYLAAMLKRYGGDPAKAWAAYNAGPGALDDALKAGGNWLARMPKETRDYVTQNVAALGGNRKGAKPSLEDALAAAENHPLVAGSTARIKIVRDEVERRYRISEATTKDDRERAREQAILALEQNGGNFAGLPPSIRTRLDPDDHDTVRAYANTIAKGGEPQTNFDLYYLLKSDPKALQQANLNAYRPMLGNTEFKELVTLQANARNNPAARTQVQTDKQKIDMRLTELGIDPTPDPKKGKEGAAQVGRIWSLYGERIGALENSLGRKATEDERDAVIDRMFLTVNVRQGLGIGAKPVALLEADDKVDIPKADRTQIVAALTKAKRPVTEQAIVATYLAKIKRGGTSAD